MAGFEDDFGEMVGGKGSDDLLTSEETNEDPAAEFLAREQEELGAEEHLVTVVLGGHRQRGGAFEQ